MLDLTRVLAGPICTRFLAAFGAEILRIDPPGWAEPNVVAEVSVGKRCATLDLRAPADRERLQQLIADADLMVHGLRPGALDALGFSASERRRLNPRLIDVSLCAYGWTGPWAERRGYDSLVQMSCGIADAGMRLSNADKPTPLPVQALDHATGYLMAAAALRALRVRNHDGRSLTARLSLARTAALLIETQTERLPQALPTERSADVVNDIEATDWGPAQRLRFPATVPGVTPRWLSPAREFHSAPASWR